MLAKGIMDPHSPTTPRTLVCSQCGWGARGIRVALLPSEPRVSEATAGGSEKTDARQPGVLGTEPGTRGESGSAAPPRCGQRGRPAAWRSGGSLAPCLPGVSRAARQRLGVQQRQGAINKGGQLPSARCQLGGTAPGNAGRSLPPALSSPCWKSRGKPEHRPRSRGARRSGRPGRAGGSGDARRHGSVRGCMLARRTVPRAPLVGSATSAPT